MDYYYTWFIKTGRGRTTEDAGLEIRNKIITREEDSQLKNMMVNFQKNILKRY